MDRPSKLARFKPLRRASRDRLRLLYSVGPVLWVIAIALVAVDVNQGDAVAIALIALGVSLLLSIVMLLPMRARRVRLERKR